MVKCLVSLFIVYWEQRGIRRLAGIEPQCRGKKDKKNHGNTTRKNLLCMFGKLSRKVLRGTEIEVYKSTDRDGDGKHDGIVLHGERLNR